MHVAHAIQPPHAQSSPPTGTEMRQHDVDACPADGLDDPAGRLTIASPDQRVASIDVAPGRQSKRLELAPDLTPQNGRVGPDLTRSFNGSGLAAAVAGFERWARDRMAGAKGVPSADTLPTAAELAEREAIQDAWQREARQEVQERWARDARADAFL